MKHVRNPDRLDSGSYCEYDFAALIAKAFGMKYSVFRSFQISYDCNGSWDYEKVGITTITLVVVVWIINKCLGLTILKLLKIKIQWLLV